MATVEATLNFYLDPALGGHDHYTTGTTGYYRRKFDEHKVAINNIRGREEELSLSTHGFEYHKHSSAEELFDDDNRIKNIVYPEVAQVLKDATGATDVFVFSHLVRRSSREAVQKRVDSEPGLEDDSVVLPDVTPARFIHIDFSVEGAHKMLRDNFPQYAAEAQKLKSKRWAIINLWRPIKPIAKDPLALCDARTVRDEDLMPVSVTLPQKGTGQYGDNVSKGEGFELYYLRYNPDQTWHYIDSMQPGEIIVLKCFDSIQDGTATRVPHSSFTNPDTADDENRESIEVRSFVFWDEQGAEIAEHS